MRFVITDHAAQRIQERVAPFVVDADRWIRETVEDAIRDARAFARPPDWMNRHRCAREGYRYITRKTGSREYCIVVQMGEQRVALITVVIHERDEPRAFNADLNRRKMLARRRKAPVL